MNTSAVNPAAHISAPSEPAARPLPQDQRELIQAVKAVNATEPFGDDSELTFLVDSKARRVITRIVNRKTGEVIRQIPAEYVRRLANEITKG